ncbi:MAG: FMN-binding protein [Bacteroidia bacterium]|nr:FMN-binding protein [Bacteroidia bacterium]
MAANNNSKGFSTNSNTYTIVYAVVMVVIVAFLLAFAHSALGPTQDENVKLDTKKQILSSLNITDYTDAQAAFTKNVVKILDKTGAEKCAVADFDVTGADKNEVIYQCEVDGATKYVIPMNGNGLWGAIWGYIALNDNKSTVYGIYFNHASETAGLGAEIVKPAFCNQFKDKNIQRDSVLTSIAVVKKGQSVADKDYVDGISGGTITSSAVSVMLETNLKKFEGFLTK